MKKAFSFRGYLPDESFDASAMRNELTGVAGDPVDVRIQGGECLVSGRIEEENVSAVRRRMDELGILE